MSSYEIDVAARPFPELVLPAIEGTRDALHAYSRVLGNWLKLCRGKRKHWWHASLRPSLAGLTTGVIHGPVDFEIELNLIESVAIVRTSAGDMISEELYGQSGAELADAIAHFLIVKGLPAQFVPEIGQSAESTELHPEYTHHQAHGISLALNRAAAALTTLRAGIPEETSPIQLWPHHFDLSMIWLPGEKIPGQDPADEEHSDKQMNFGFTFGDSGTPEPYFYATAYPSHEALAATPLPAGATWQTEGFDGAVLPYRLLTAQADPAAYLLDLWRGLLSAGRQHLLSPSA